MKLQRLLLFFVFYFFVNILLQGQDKKNTKYQEHPITVFSFNLGVNYTAAAKGSIAPGYLAGLDFEHHFQSSPFGFNIGVRNMRLSAKNNLMQSNFWITEFFGKISYRISKNPIYVNAGFSSARIYEHEGYLPGLQTRTSFLNLGAEHKFFIPKKLLVSAGINYKLTNIYDLEFGFLNTLEVVFKVGKF